MRLNWRGSPTALSEPEKSRTLALLGATGPISSAILAKAPFSNRGFSDRTINALTAHGLRWPEQLLSMPDLEIVRIKGIGQASLREISNYRAKVLPGAE